MRRTTSSRRSPTCTTASSTAACSHSSDVSPLVEGDVMPLPEYLEVIRAKVSNWGRWGDDDQIGTANLLTAEAAARGAAAVRSGRRFSLALELKADGPQVGQPPRRMNPLLTLTTLHE